MSKSKQNLSGGFEFGKGLWTALFFCPEHVLDILIESENPESDYETAQEDDSSRSEETDTVMLGSTVLA